MSDRMFAALMAFYVAMMVGVLYAVHLKREEVRGCVARGWGIAECKALSDNGDL